jgi:MarR family transcriptional regulator, transcriptional regulator for hemolysin
MIGPWLQHVGRAWRAATDTAFAEFGLSYATGMALIYVHRLGGQMRQGELARCMAIEGPSLVRLLDQLANAGLVRRRDDPSDRRAKHLELTELGRAEVERVERRLNIVRDRLLSEVNDADLSATLRVLELIADATGETLPLPADSVRP